MKKLAYVYLMSLFSTLFSVQALCAQDPAKETFIHLFLQICAGTHGQNSGVEKISKELGFSEVTGEELKKYLPGTSVRAWGGTVDLKNFVVTAQPNGTCSLLVFGGEATLIQAAVDAWLPPETTGIAVKKEELATNPARPTLKSTSYELRGGRVQERWVVTISSESASLLRAILSWNEL